MKFISRICVIGALLVATLSLAQVGWVRPDYTVKFQAHFETQAELVEFLSSYFVTQRKYKAFGIGPAGREYSQIVFRSPQKEEVLVHGTARGAALACVVLDFEFNSTLEFDIHKRKPEALAAAKSAAASFAAWVRGSGGIDVQQLSPADMHSINDHQQCGARSNTSFERTREG